MELFTAKGKLKKFFLLQLEIFDMCTDHCSSEEYRCTHTDGCGNNFNIQLMCAVSPVVNTSNISSCQNNFFSFPVAVNNSINVGPLVFLL
jgi:hypothetical protein